MLAKRRQALGEQPRRVHSACSSRVLTGGKHKQTTAQGAAWRNYNGGTPEPLCRRCLVVAINCNPLIPQHHCIL